MSARIARGAASGRARPKAKAPARSKARKKPPPPGLLEGLPIAEATIRRAGLWLVLLMVLAIALAVAVALRVPQMVGISIGEAVGRAGFAVNGYEIKGLKRMDRAAVDRVAERQIGVAMPLVDLDGTRAQLLRYGWIQDARVSRRFPDRLIVDIVERQPAAIWQHQGELALIDASGIVLDQVTLDAMPDLPRVIGPDANRHVGALADLIGAAPRLKPLISGATWIGGRRWDLLFQTGETLALPEGQAAAMKALALFAQMDRKTQLLGRGFARFDLRLPGKMYVRISSEPGTVVPDLPPPPPPPPPPPSGAALDPTTTI